MGKKILFIAIILIISGFLGFLYISTNNPKETKPIEENDTTASPNANMEETLEPGGNGKNEFPSNFTSFTDTSNQFTFNYPEDWRVRETTPENGTGPFGPIQSSWILTSFNPDNYQGTGGIPENSVKIDFQISTVQYDTNLEEVLNCNEQGTDCSEIEINNVNYTKAVSETGQAPILVYGTIQNNTLYLASALFGPGGNLNNRRDLVTTISETFQINTTN